ncbi:hypothetical protein AURDEDRAFT_173450 [Auricularia subglabra TFB-10046 SS5]|nr:hypothetical protein AURDEDRAFT_173450 [Auricularia subglabra TFB-10046 SS5]
MVLNTFLKLVPPRPPSPPGRYEKPRPVDLPYELMRVIFELAVVSDMRTSRRLLATAKWIRAWIARDVFTTQLVRTHRDMNYLFHQSDADLALVRNLWVNIRSQRLPGLLARMPHVERLALCISAARMYGNPPVSVFAAPIPLREFEFVAPEPTFLLGPSAPYRVLRQPTFRITHLRLDFIHGGNGYSVAEYLHSQAPTFPHLTHLAYDAFVAYPPKRHIYGDILASPALPALQVFAIVVSDGRDAQPQVDRLLSLHLERLVVLVDPPRQSRTRDWKARAEGHGGFWERVETLGVTAFLPS